MRNLFLVMLLGTSPALAQENGPIQPMPMQGGIDHSAMMGAMGMGAGMGSAPVSEPGQGAFAAIGEIVARLEADPDTDWSKVSIDALRAHLVDMDMVVTWSEVVTDPIDFGARFTVTGNDKVAGAIQRMVLAHAATMEGSGGWSFVANSINGGATLDVMVPEADMPKLQAMGFFGILTSGMHHQAHHWMLATGENPHP
ncbi:MAG TPA: hypothetical protein ENJ52_05115 [Aliiroseovarius sp.]|nr:hypothetical protein [Aliiroseovarius sp.]